MPDTFALTIAFIILSSAVAAFVSRTSKDKCLKDFFHDLITLEKTNGKLICGTLNVENTGLEFVYPTRLKNESGYNEASYLLYKHEYPNCMSSKSFGQNRA